jgi:hypothetical protein
MKPNYGKQIVYRHNGDPKYDEIVKDPTGEIPRCKVGEILLKKGKRWKVAVVHEDFTMAGSNPFPVQRVFLTDKF